jgi:hypothetical protein
MVLVLVVLLEVLILLLLPSQLAFNPFYSITSAFEDYDNDVTRVEITPSIESFVKQNVVTAWFRRTRATADLSRPAFTVHLPRLIGRIFRRMPRYLFNVVSKVEGRAKLRNTPCLYVEQKMFFETD